MKIRIEKNQESLLVSVKRKAAKGDAEAQYILGLMYDDGNGVSQDQKKAKEWYEKAAVQGNAEAQCNLGVMYNNGKGVSQDQKKAREWYEKAAAQGNVGAQYNLGVMYYNGRGVAQDYKKAKEWFEKSAAQGNENAIQILKEYEFPEKSLLTLLKKNASYIIGCILLLLWSILKRKF